MGVYTKLIKKIAAVTAATVVSAAVLPLWQVSVPVWAGQEVIQEDREASELTLESVRSEAAASYSGTEKMGFDLELAGHSFTGAAGLDYSQDTADRKYMQGFQNLKDRSESQTIIFRFRTTAANAFLFGTGIDGINNGKNMTFSLNNGKLRFRLRNQKKLEGGTAAGLQGNVGSNLNDGKYHTVAVSFHPGLGYAVGNVNLVIDASQDLYPAQWCPEWKAGFDQNNEAFTKFHIGSSALYGGDANGAALNGSLDFITVLNKGYTLQELQRLTAGDKDYRNFTEMFSGGTCNTWLFTGGTEGVADFAGNKTTRNWVGIFESSLRESGTFVERGRFVFNTAKKGADLAQLLDEYDTRILPFGTRVVGVMIGAADYRKKAEGLETFEETLTELLNRLVADRKIPLLLTPYPSQEASDAAEITRYTEAIERVAGEKFKIVDFSDLDPANLNSDGGLTPQGHQIVANKIKDAVGAGGKTSFTFDMLSDGSYTVAKQKDGVLAQLLEVSAGADSITFKTEEASVDTDAALEYTLKDSKGISISGEVPAGDTEFTIGGLKKYEQYLLHVYDTGRGSVRESYQPVSILTAEGEQGTAAEYEDHNRSVNEKIKETFTQDEAATWLFMGDSITHGVVTQGYDNVPQMFAKYLDEAGRTDDIVLNTGVTNATIATTLHQIEPRLKRYRPDVVFVMLGTNDVSVNGENTVTDAGSAVKGGITPEQYKERYKTLVGEIYETNPNASVVLRVPCEMKNAGQGNPPFPAHDGYEEKFAKIYEVAEEMREEHPGFNVTVVNHLKEWRDYRDNVRNDNIMTSGYGWLVADGVHPNGRGNLSMFQQLMKELGLYVHTSELVNYQYELSDWTDTSDLEVTVTQRGSRASVRMNALSGYTNGLKNVTLTLTADGRSIGTTADYAADGSITVDGLDASKPYTPSVTGKDAENSKEITFAASLVHEGGSDSEASADEKRELEDTLQAAEELDVTEYPQVIRNDYQAAILAVKEKYPADGELTSAQIDAALEEIRFVQANMKTLLAKFTEAKEALEQALLLAKKTLDGGKEARYSKDDWDNFTTIYRQAEAAAADESLSADELLRICSSLISAEQKLLNPPQILPPPPKVKKNKTYDIGDYQYLVTDLVKQTVTVTGTKNAGLSKIVILDQVKLLDGKTYQVTEVRSKAFLNHKKANSIQIGKNVEKIGAQAFSNCPALKKAVIRSTRLAEIGGKAFYKDKNLKSIEIKSKKLKKVGKKAFKGTAAKLKLIIPKKKYAAYKKLLAKKGQNKSASIKKK